MQRTLSNSVTITYLDYEQVMNQLQQAAAQLKQSNEQVVRVMLFGSLVQGNYGPRSDADVLIVLASDERRVMDRVPEYLAAFSNVSIGVDVFPLTEEEIQIAIKGENMFVKRILQEGVELGAEGSRQKSVGSRQKSVGRS